MCCKANPSLRRALYLFWPTFWIFGTFGFSTRPTREPGVSRWRSYNPRRPVCWLISSIWRRSALLPANPRTFTNKYGYRPRQSNPPPYWRRVFRKNHNSLSACTSARPWLCPFSLDRPNRLRTRQRLYLNSNISNKACNTKHSSTTTQIRILTDTLPRFYYATM